LRANFWHVDELIQLLIKSYWQFARTCEFAFVSVAEDAALADMAGFREMVERTPFLGR
jgi:hypothetical protein